MTHDVAGTGQHAHCNVGAFPQSVGFSVFLLNVSLQARSSEASHLEFNKIPRNVQDVRLEERRAGEGASEWTLPRLWVLLELGRCWAGDIKMKLLHAQMNALQLPPSCSSSHCVLFSPSWPALAQKFMFLNFTHDLLTVWTLTFLWTGQQTSVTGRRTAENACYFPPFLGKFKKTVKFKRSLLTQRFKLVSQHDIIVKKII